MTGERIDALSKLHVILTDGLTHSIEQTACSKAYFIS